MISLWKHTTVCKISLCISCWIKNSWVLSPESWLAQLLIHGPILINIFWWKGPLKIVELLLHNCENMKQRSRESHKPDKLKKAKWYRLTKFGILWLVLSQKIQLIWRKVLFNLFFEFITSLLKLQINAPFTSDMPHNTTKVWDLWLCN